VDGRPEKRANAGIWKNPWFTQILLPLLLGVSAIIVAGVIVNNTSTNEFYLINTQNQSGGFVIGKVEGDVNVTIITDKETLGIRESTGLYQDGEKVGHVFGFVANESANSFEIQKIEFDQPIRNSELIWQPYEYQNYTIKIQKIDNLTMLLPAEAEGIYGIILVKN